VFNSSLAGGCLLDMGIYPIAIARLFIDRDPQDVHVISRHAPNGVDDDVSMLFDYGERVATLTTSFRCKLPNSALIIGTEGYIEIPHFWAARECRLVVMHDIVDTFADDRQGSGFEFQIEAASADILAGRTQSEVVPHAASLAFQEDMDRVKAGFNR
jgi:predicted dehydrogenase